MGKIDVVISWVDGADPILAEKRQAYLSQTPNIHTEAVSKTRFENRGEIYFCVASILKYASFINRIWIITDGQRPAKIDAFASAGLCKADFIQVIDHVEIFHGYERFLPTFNSLSIESMLWRIPGLAEQFVYMNDDFFINHTISPDDFFRNGLPRIHGSLAKPDHMRIKIRLRRFLRKITLRPAKSRPSFRVSQERAANIVGNHGNFLSLGHHPHPMRKSVTEAFHVANPMVLETQIAYRFRHRDQYFPISLANSIEMRWHGVPFEPSLDVDYVKPAKANADSPGFKGIQRGACPYGCIQSLDEASDEKIQFVTRLMAEKFGHFLPDSIISELS